MLILRMVVEGQSMSKPLCTENNASSELRGQERTSTLLECISKVCSKVSGKNLENMRIGSGEKAES